MIKKKKSSNELSHPTNLIPVELYECKAAFKRGKHKRSDLIPI